MIKKRCPKCGQVKFAEEFYVRKDRRSGRYSWCKVCFLLYLKEYWIKRRRYDKNYDIKFRESYQKRNKKWYLKNKEIAQKYGQKLRLKVCQKISGLEKPVCAECGCDDLRLLEVNHIDGGGSREVRKLTRSKFCRYILNGKRKTDDLNILCRMCNALYYFRMKFGNIPMKIIWKGSEKK